MDRKQAHFAGRTPETEAYCQRLMDVAAAQRLPQVFQEERPGTVWHTRNRHGVSVIGLRRSALKDEELVSLLRYRLGQYVHPNISIIDPRLVHRDRMEHEPLANESPGDIHFIAGDPETGEILCYAVLRALPDHPEGTTLRHRERPLLPVEKVNGWGVFNRLERLPELPLKKVFELGRYVKNHCRPSDDLSTRAPTEIALAVFLSLLGPLRNEVHGFVGDLEERIAKRTLDFFHIPLVLIRGVVPYSPEASYFFPRNQYCTVYPFAVLVEDVEGSADRFEAIRQALEQPGDAGMKALFGLKKTSMAKHSSLEPEEGLSELTVAELPDQGGEMRFREQLLDIAADLRTFDAFCNLNDAEMRLLGGFMKREDVPAGHYIVRQGEMGGDMYLIDEGEADVLKHNGDGPPIHIATLGPGYYFGEIALLNGGERTADVVAKTSMSLLRLSKEAYTRFLARLDEVQGRIAETAAARSSSPA